MHSKLCVHPSSAERRLSLAFFWNLEFRSSGSLRETIEGGSGCGYGPAKERAPERGARTAGWQGYQRAFSFHRGALGGPEVKIGHAVDPLLQITLYTSFRIKFSCTHMNYCV